LDAKLNSTPSPTMRPCFLQRTGIRPTGGWKIYTPSPVPSIQICVVYLNVLLKYS
jgi:hypothetical protein